MYKEFSTFLTAALKERKLSPEAAANATGIPDQVLLDLLAGDADHLPAAPYLHGYLVKLGTFLDFDGEEWWQRLKRTEPVQSSGTGDLLPKNRFSRNRVPKWLLWGVPVILLLLTFLGFRFAEILGLPEVAIVNPDRDGIVLTASPVMLSGTATPQSRVTINGEAVPVTEEGTWQKEVMLQPGSPNDFTVEATKLLGRSRSTSRRIFYEAPVVSTTTTSTVSTATSTDETASSTEPLLPQEPVIQE